MLHSTGKRFKTVSDLEEYLGSVSPRRSRNRKQNVIRTLSTYEWVYGKRFFDEKNPKTGDMLAIKEKMEYLSGKKIIYYIQKMEDGSYLYDYMEVSINAFPKFTYSLYDSEDDETILSEYKLSEDS